jgi:N-acetylglucosamine-6-phosphate deacetylase
LHLEGPWINPIRRGAHEASIIHAPSLPEVKELLDYGDGVVKMITLAPEVCTQEVIDYILSKNIIISAGHSNATDKEATDGFNRGITAVTHLFNAMSPLLHRAPGLPGATFSDDKVFASIIADGYHVDYSIIRIAKTLMKERLFLITDAVTETDSGYYKHKATGDKYEAHGILSGSGLDMAKAVRNMINFAGIEIDEALRMASTYPASVMKLDKLGKIKKENTARMVVLDSNLEVKQVL